MKKKKLLEITHNLQSKAGVSKTQTKYHFCKEKKNKHKIVKV